MTSAIEIAEHPLLELGCFAATYPQPLGELTSPPELLSCFRLDADAPVATGDDVRKAVRDLLRGSGFKPTGRSKPAAEYLLRAAGEGKLSSINPAVDANNAASLHSGLPISVVDIDKIVLPLRVEIAPPGTSYVFNLSGQVIDVGGLLCLFDADGPCANAVKDAQRTKTDEQSTRTLSLVWGTRALPGHLDRTVDWYRRLVELSGAAVDPD